jgi:hypothetical protein
VAKAALTKRAMEFITAEVEVQGNPAVRPGALVNIKKVGPYSGHYLVTEANHYYDAAGYNCIFYLARDKWGNSSAPAAAQARAPQSPPANQFVDLELADDAGVPVAEAAYEVLTADGRVLTGKLDAKGKARVHGVGPGQCRVSFPELHPDAWKPV